jgi:hypothetical protein
VLPEFKRFSNPESTFSHPWVSTSGALRNEEKKKPTFAKAAKVGHLTSRMGENRFRVRYELTLLFHGNVGHGGAMQLVAHSDRQGFAIGTCNDARDADHLSITFVGFFDGVLA